MPLSLPFFKFDVQAWLTSETVTLMKNEQRGGFITLLSKCWATATCTLPNDIAKVKALAEWEGTDEHFLPIWRCFRAHKTLPDRVFNIRLMKEWNEAKRKQRFYAERAKLGAIARWTEKIPRLRMRKPATAQRQDWLDAMKHKPIYAHINWVRELGKIDEWHSRAENTHRVINQRFVANWVNKIDPPLVNGTVATLTCPHHPTLTFPDAQAKKVHDFSYHPNYVG